MVLGYNLKLHNADDLPTFPSIDGYVGINRSGDQNPGGNFAEKGRPCKAVTMEDPMAPVHKLLSLG